MIASGTFGNQPIAVKLGAVSDQVKRLSWRLADHRFLAVTFPPGRAMIDARMQTATPSTDRALREARFHQVPVNFGGRFP